MIIVEDYNNLQIDLISITSINYLGDFAMKLFFNDGTNQLVNFKPFLETSLHPSICKYLDETLFKQVEIIDGNLNWNNYDMIFPLEDLYIGKI